MTEQQKVTAPNSASEMRGGRMLHVGVPTERSKDFKGSMKRLFERLGPERSKLWGVMAFALLGVALSVSGPKVLGHATNLVFEGVFRKLKGGEGIDFHALAMTALVALLQMLGDALREWLDPRSADAS